MERKQRKPESGGEDGEGTAEESQAPCQPRLWALCWQLTGWGISSLPPGLSNGSGSHGQCLRGGAWFHCHPAYHWKTPPASVDLMLTCFSCFITVSQGQLLWPWKSSLYKKRWVSDMRPGWASWPHYSTEIDCVIFSLKSCIQEAQWWRICLWFRRLRFDPWVGKMPWRRKWPPTPVFLPGKSHGQRSLAGYSPWVCNESDTT